MHGACGDNDDVARVQYMADATLDARSTHAGPGQIFLRKYTAREARGSLRGGDGIDVNEFGFRASRARACSHY